MTPRSAAPDHPHGHDHSHSHDHPHRDDHPYERDRAPHDDERSGQTVARTVRIEEDLLSKNDRLAQRNRAWLAGRDALTVNLMSSPGSGKTTLLERTIRGVSPTRPVCVVEGDQETLIDADRIRATGCPVVQINTGSGCHLDAAMLARGLQELDPPVGALVLVENVGNLVCPALFDLGESRRVVIVSVTEGAEKPLKYPHMFAAADLVLVNKIDLLPYVDFDLDQFAQNARKTNGRTALLAVSATRGDGLEEWYDWLKSTMRGLSRMPLTP